MVQRLGKSAVKGTLWQGNVALIKFGICTDFINSSTYRLTVFHCEKFGASNFEFSFYCELVSPLKKRILNKVNRRFTFGGAGVWVSKNWGAINCKF